MKTAKWIMVLMTITAGLVNAAKIDESGFYKGNYAPDGDYILSGGLIKDLPPPIEVPVHHSPRGFDGSRLTKVPPHGVHPRIIIGPSDVERFKQLAAMGAKAPRIFRLQMEQMRRDAEKWEIPPNHNYGGSPWGEDSKIAGWGLYALITGDRELGRKGAEATVQHALYVEPWADIVNSDPQCAPIKNVAYDFIRMGLKFDAVDYKTAFYQGGKGRVEALYKEHGVSLAANSPAPGCLTLAFEYDYAHPFMTERERAIVRRVISKITYGKYTTGMALPGQMFINNHMSGSANQTYLALAIEGEEGYDPRIAKMAEWSLANKLSYDLSSDGITYENTKGFIPMLPVLAIARRQGADHPQNLLKHSHLLARANSNVQHARKLYSATSGTGVGARIPSRMTKSSPGSTRNATGVPPVAPAPADISNSGRSSNTSTRRTRWSTSSGTASCPALSATTRGRPTTTGAGRSTTIGFS